MIRKKSDFGGNFSFVFFLILKFPTVPAHPDYGLRREQSSVAFKLGIKCSLQNLFT